MTTPVLTVVLPCLNEADTLAICLRRIRQGLADSPASYEVIVADNGSTDGSPDIAVAEGATLVHVDQRGYGSALMGGIAASRGKWIVIADADASYDLGDIPRFLEALSAGHDMVMGCRLPAGGGRVAPGAMPWLHRWVGNPAFSALARKWFKAPVHDVHCGMRGFTRRFYDRLDLQCTGMEFASEMVIKASLLGGRLAELPITLYPDQRRTHSPHLRTFRDGWRHLRFYLLFSPRWLFGVPGLALIALGLIAGAVAYPGIVIGGVGFDVHTLLFAGLFVLLGTQMALYGVLAKTFAVSQGLLPPSRVHSTVARWLRIEAGIGVGVLCGVSGAVLLAWAVVEWGAAGLGALDYSRTMRIVIPGATLATLGLQVIFASFLSGVFALPRRPPSGHPVAQAMIDDS